MYVIYYNVNFNFFLSVTLNNLSVLHRLVVILLVIK